MVYRYVYPYDLLIEYEWVGYLAHDLGHIVFHDSYRGHGGHHGHYRHHAGYHRGHH